MFQGTTRRLRDWDFVSPNAPAAGDSLSKPPKQIQFLWDWGKFHGLGIFRQGFHPIVNSSRDRPPQKGAVAAEEAVKPFVQGVGECLKRHRNWRRAEFQLRLASYPLYYCQNASAFLSEILLILHDGTMLMADEVKGVLRAEKQKEKFENDIQEFSDAG